MEIISALNEHSGETERLQDRAIKALACLEVRHSQVNMIDKPSEVEFHVISSAGADGMD
jgi:hypothetical protein